MELYNLVR